MSALRSLWLTILLPLIAVFALVQWAECYRVRVANQRNIKSDRMTHAFSLCWAYINDHDVMPNSINDSEPYKAKHPEGYHAIDEGHVLVFWGLPLLAVDDPKAEEQVIGRENCPGQGWQLLRTGRLYMPPQ